MSSRFVAPKSLTSLEQAATALQLVQEQLDALSAVAAPRLHVSNVTLRAGEFIRLAPRQGKTLVAKLPKADSSNAGQAITISLEAPDGELRVSAEHPDQVNGGKVATFDLDGVIRLTSNGVDRWVSTNQVPTSSPGGAALDAQYVLGAAHPSLPNGRLATDSTEVDAVVSTPGVISWALNAASVAFSKLANLTGLSVLGRAANSSGVMAAITATAARQILRNNDAGTALEWGNPVEVRNNANTDLGDAFSLRFNNGTRTTATSSFASGQGQVQWSWDGVGIGVDEAYLGGLFRDLSFVTSSPGLSIGVTDLGGFAASIEFSLIDLPLASLEDVAADSFLGNFTGSFGAVTARAGASVAGAGLTYTTGGTLAVGSSTSVIVNANDVQRAALTGAIAAAANSNATVFAGVRVNDTALANNVFLDFANTSTITAAANDAFVGVAGTTTRYTFTVNLAANYTWTGVHSFTGASHTVNVAGATNITAGAGINLDAAGTSTFDTTVGNITIQTTAAGSRVSIVGQDDVLIAATDDDVFINAGDLVAVAATNAFRVSTNAIERLEIEPDGAWQLGGNTGSAGEVITSAGGAAPPVWGPGPALIEVRSAFAADASITVTPPAEATWFEFEMQAAGGGGGGAETAATDGAIAAGAGGGEGEKCRGYRAIVSGNITGSIGAGGTAGAAATGGNGGNGGNTVLTYNAASVTCTGGFGGVGSGNAAATSGTNVADNNSAVGGSGGGSAGTSDSSTFFYPGASGGAAFMATGATLALPGASSTQGPAVMGGFGGGAHNTGSAQARTNAVAQGGNNGSRGSGAAGAIAITDAAASASAAGGVGGSGWMIIRFFSGAVPTFGAIT